MLRKKKKGFTLEREIGSFRIRITEARADIETFGREVKWTFLLGTKQYFHFKSYFEREDWKTIEFLVKTMYNVFLVFSDAKLAVDINKLIAESLPRIQENLAGKQTPSTEKDEEILAQEKLKFEAQEELKKLKKEENETKGRQG